MKVILKRVRDDSYLEIIKADLICCAMEELRKKAQQKKEKEKQKGKE